MAALLVRQPERYDVICATNFHADILSDLASELSGSLGLAGSVNAGDDLCCAQAQHGSAPTLAGQDKANPSRSEEHTSELQSLMRSSYAVFCLKKKTKNN